MTETIPSAIARGAEAQTPGAIRPVRAGIFAGVLAALFVLVTFVFTSVPDRALSLVGADASEVGRYGGMRLVWVPPAGADLAKVEQTFRRHEGARVSREDDALVVEVGGVLPDDVEYAAELIRRGGLAFHRVVITRAMPDLASGHGVPMFDAAAEAHAPVSLEIDQWMPEDGGSRKTDYFLFAENWEDIAKVVADAEAKGWALPEGTHIAFEYVEGWDGRKGFWRTYVIETQPALGGEHVANATRSYDPNTNRPIVLLDFTREGAQLFGNVTAGMVGDKLATVLGDGIVSAPIINAPIRGGRASITMGGSDVATQEAERDALVAALKAGSLPAGGTLREAKYIAPTVTSMHEWLARLLLSLFAGLIVGLVAWVLVRTTHPVWRTPEVRLPGKVSWLRLVVLLLAPIAVIGASKIIAPGIDSSRVYEITHDPSFFSLGMLGLSPLLSSFFLVELVATIVPSWRRRRHAGPTARLPFDVAILVTAIVISILQAWSVAVYLERLDALPYGLDRMLFLASLVGATLGFAFIAWLIRVYGVGNGYAALLVTGIVWAAYKKIAISPEWSTSYGRDVSGWLDKSHTYLALIAMVVPAIAMIAVLRTRISRAGEVPLRVPTSGTAPLGVANGLLALILVALGMATIGALSEKIYVAQNWLQDVGTALALGFVVVFAVVWSWAFARPSVLDPFARRAGLTSPSREAWRSATILTAGTLVVIASGHALLGASTLNGMAGTITSVVFAAFILDAYDDLRGRRGRLSYVWSLQSAQHADIAAHVLEKQEIAFHLAGTSLRTMLAWFGPFAQIDVWVRREDVGRARETLAAVFATVDIGAAARSTPVELAK
jgi:preprotein translocase subunit SecY